MHGDSFKNKSARAKMSRCDSVKNESPRAKNVKV